MFVATDLKVRLPFSGCLSGGANQAVTRTPAHDQLLLCDYAAARVSHMTWHACCWNHILEVSNYLSLPDCQSTAARHTELFAELPMLLSSAFEGQL